MNTRRSSLLSVQFHAIHSYVLLLCMNNGIDASTYCKIMVSELYFFLSMSKYMYLYPVYWTMSSLSNWIIFEPFLGDVS